MKFPSLLMVAILWLQVRIGEKIDVQIVILITLELIFNLFNDTKSKHDINLITKSEWTIFITILYTIVLFQIIQTPAKDNATLLYYSGIVFGLLGTLLVIWEFPDTLITFRLILIWLTVLIISLVLLSGNTLARTYAGIFFIKLMMLLEFESIPAFEENLLLYLNEAIEILIILGIVGILALIAKTKARWWIFDQTYNFSGYIIILAAALGAFVGTVVSNNEIASLILKIIFDQIFGIDQGAIDLWGINLTSSQVLTLHIIELFILVAILITFKRPALEFALLLTGLNVNFPLTSGMRLMVLLYIHKEFRKNDDQGSTIVEEKLVS